MVVVDEDRTVEEKLARRKLQREISLEDLALDSGPWCQEWDAAEVLAASRTGGEWHDAWMTFRHHALREEARRSLERPSGGRMSAYCWAELSADVDRLAAIGDHEQARDLCLRISVLADWLAMYHDRKAGR